MRSVFYVLCDLYIQNISSSDVYPGKYEMNLNEHNARIKEKLTETKQNKNTFFNTKIFWCKNIFFGCTQTRSNNTQREWILLATAACFLPAYPVKTPCNIPTTSVIYTKKRRGIIMPQPACVVVVWRWGFVENEIMYRVFLMLIIGE